MAEKFVIGDKVQLKSGGPVMTVVEVPSATTVRVKWFSGKKSEADYFPNDALRRPSQDDDEE